jgi:heme oxygenase (mycobilin-producing)
MRQKRGYLEHKLHRSLQADAQFRFINVARWASQADFDAAHDEGFRALVTQDAWAPFRSRPALYEIIHEAQADQLLQSR